MPALHVMEKRKRREEDHHSGHDSQAERVDAKREVLFCGNVDRYGRGRPDVYPQIDHLEIAVPAYSYLVARCEGDCEEY